MCPTRAEGISCEMPSTMPRPARRIGTSVNFFPATWLPVVRSSGVSISTVSSGKSFVTSYAMSIAISLTSCLKSRVLVFLSRRIVSLCWISGCDSTVKLGNCWEVACAMAEKLRVRLRPRDRPLVFFSPRFKEGCMLLAFVTTLALAQANQAPVQSVDSLIAKYIQASGGMERVQAIQTLRRTGKYTGGGGHQAVVVQENKRPNSVREEFQIQGMVGVNAYDGRDGWKIQPWEGKRDPESLGEEEMHGILDDADFDGPLVNYKAKGNRVEYQGIEQIEGSDAYKLK